MSKDYAAYVSFQKGWMHDRLERCTALRKQWDNQEAPKVSAKLFRFLLKSVRATLEPVLPPAPMFVITDYNTAQGDPGKGKIGLTAWGATVTKAPVPKDKWWYHTCPPTPQQTQDSMYEYAKYVNADWVVAPVFAFLLRYLYPWATEEERRVVQVLEFPIDHTLPVYQFEINGEKKYMASKDAICFNVVQLDAALAMDTVRKMPMNVRAIKRGDAVVPEVDPDFTLFLLRRNAKMRRLTEVFDAALDKCQRFFLKNLLEFEGPRYNSQNPENPENLENLENSENSENSKNSENSENPKNLKKSNGAEGSVGEEEEDMALKVAE